MNENKRTTEALSLRTFFDEQIEYLQTLLNHLNNYLEQTQQAKHDEQIIENFIDVANKKMRAVDDYTDKLRYHVKALYNHILLIAEQIPAPIDLNSNTFKTNGLINALFVNYRDIEKLLTSSEINTFLNQYQEKPSLYAILTATRNEKTKLGIAMQGDMLVRDTILHEVNFSSYQIHTPCPNSEALTSALKTHLFNRVVQLLKQEIETQIKNQPLFQTNSYEAKINSLANPEVYLNTLIKYMENPSELLTIEKTHLKLNKLGIKLNQQDETQNTNEFDIYELVWRDNLRIVILQICHPC